MRTKNFVPAVLALVALAGCKPDAKQEAPAAEAPTAEAPTADKPTAEVPTAPPSPEEAVNRSATEAERALAEAFIERFLTALEADDPAGWPALHTTSQRADLLAKNAVEQSYEAWQKGTLTVAKRIREGGFALQKRGDVFLLRFVGVRVPTDPDVEYTMTVAIEDGEMRIGEK